MKFKKIKKIENTNTKPIYHLTVEKNHNFFGNGFCLHNCDFYNNPSTGGNIMIGLKNIGRETQYFEKEEGLVQGIFTKYLVADNCNTDEVRKGGIGSTNK